MDSKPRFGEWVRVYYRKGVETVTWLYRGKISNWLAMVLVGKSVNTNIKSYLRYKTIFSHKVALDG